MHQRNPVLQAFVPGILRTDGQRSGRRDDLGEDGRQRFRIEFRLHFVEGNHDLDVGRDHPGGCKFMVQILSAALALLSCC